MWLTQPNLPELFQGLNKKWLIKLDRIKTTLVNDLGFEAQVGDTGIVDDPISKRVDGKVIKVVEI